MTSMWSWKRIATIAIAVAAVWAIIGSMAGQDISRQSRRERIESAAGLRTADAATVTNLVSELMSVAPEVPPGTSDALKQRVIKAEMDYQAGRHPGISDDQVASAVNTFADAMGAPDYAHTSREQVRDLRTSLQLSFPTLLGAKDRSSKMPLSPAEAAFVGLLMARQKVTNSNFQVAPAEWASFHKSGHSREGKIGGQKAAAMKELVNTKAAQIGESGMTAMAHQALDVMGIER